MQLAAQMPSTSAPAPSALLQPALESLQQALLVAHPDRWKAPGAVTAESAADIGSIQRDLNNTLPGLLTTADSGAVAQLVPAYRNVDALYDVLVRVTQTAVLAAPAPQSTALQQATAKLQQARFAYGDLLDSAAQTQDRRLRDVQARLATLQSSPPPPAPVCPPPAPAKPAAKPKPKPKPKPAPTATTTPSGQ
jgi:hypothetical protein